jgi:hypothetical protein
MEGVVTVWCRMRVHFLHCSGILLFECLWAIKPVSAVTFMKLNGAVRQFRRPITVLSLQRLRLDPRPVRVGCVLDSVNGTGFSSCSSVSGAMEILWFDEVEVTGFQTVFIWIYIYCFVTSVWGSLYILLVFLSI